MMIGNLIDKLQTKDSAAAAQQPNSQAGTQAAVPPVPVPQAVAQPPQQQPYPDIINRPAVPVAQRVPQTIILRQNTGGRVTMRDDDNEGIIIDLGEGISLNIPIQKRMSLGDFLKVAEKVKALEMLGEDLENKKNY